MPRRPTAGARFRLTLALAVALIFSWGVPASATPIVRDSVADYINGAVSTNNQAYLGWHYGRCSNTSGSCASTYADFAGVSWGNWTGACSSSENDTDTYGWNGSARTICKKTVSPDVDLALARKWTALSGLGTGSLTVTGKYAHNAGCGTTPVTQFIEVGGVRRASQTISSTTTSDVQITYAFDATHADVAIYLGAGSTSGCDFVYWSAVVTVTPLPPAPTPAPATSSSYWSVTSLSTGSLDTSTNTLSSLALTVDGPDAYCTLNIWQLETPSGGEGSGEGLPISPYTLLVGSSHTFTSVSLPDGPGYYGLRCDSTFTGGGYAYAYTFIGDKVASGTPIPQPTSQPLLDLTGQEVCNTNDAACATRNLGSAGVSAAHGDSSSAFDKVTGALTAKEPFNLIARSWSAVWATFALLQTDAAACPGYRINVALFGGSDPVVPSSITGYTGTAIGIDFTFLDCASLDALGFGSAPWVGTASVRTLLMGVMIIGYMWRTLRQYSPKVQLSG